MRCRRRAVVGLLLLFSLSSLYLQLHILIKKSRDITNRDLAIGNFHLNHEPGLPTNRTHSLHQEQPFLSNPAAAPVTATQQIDTVGLTPWRLQFADVHKSNVSNVSSSFAALSKEVPEPRAPNGSFPVPIDLPGVHTYLPHLKGKPEYLWPSLRVSKNRTGVKLVIGVPTIQRPNATYLDQTLQSLISNMNPREAAACLIIVFIAEPYNFSYVQNVASHLLTSFSTEINSGLIEILAPNQAYYPDLDKVPLTLNDTIERVRWRTKQNLDYAYLMLHAYSRGEYYVQLEDDVITKPGFFDSIMKAIKRYGLKWMVLKFCGLGFIGKLFRTSDLPLVAEFLLMFHTSKPGDWLLDNLLATKICSKDVTWTQCLREIRKISVEVRPALFQHIGYHSSLKGKVQKLKDKTFHPTSKVKGARPTPSLRKRTPNDNPVPTRIECSIDVYKQHAIATAYQGTSMFWGISPVTGDHIDFIYDPPISISRYYIYSGSSKHPHDIFPPSTTIEVVERPAPDKANNKITMDKEVWHTIGNFNQLGIATGQVPDSIARVSRFRIHVNTDMKTWVVLSSIRIIPGS